MKAAAAVLLAGLLAAAPASAQSAAACSGCHGTRPGAAIPPIEGRSEREIVEAMLAFKAGSRPATVMDRIARGFSEAEIRALAASLSASK